MVPRLKSLGLKLNLVLLLFFLVVGFATAAVVYVGFSRTSDNANTRSRQALEELGQQNLQEIANSQADLGALQLEWASEIGHRAATYMEEFKASGATATYDLSSLTRTPQGFWIDSDPNRRTDLLVLPRDTLDAAAFEGIAYSAALDSLLPALISGFPGEVSAESFHPVAIIFVDGSGVGRSFPPRGATYVTVPPDVDVNDLIDDLDPQHNPERKTLWTPPYQDLAGQGLVITAQTPVYEGDTYRGLFEVDLLIGNLVETVNQVRPTENGFAFYVDVEGKILRTDAYDLLANELDSQNNAVLAALIERMKVGERGVQRLTMGGQDFFVAHAPIQEVGGGFGVVAPVSELTAEAAAITAGINDEADQTITVVFISMAAMFAIALVGATYLNRKVLIRPIAALVEGTRAVAQGDFETQIPVQGDDELAALGHSFNQMTAGILERDVSLRSEVREREAAQEELRALFAAMTDRVIVFDRDGRVVRLPETSAVPIGVSPEELPGMALKDIVPADQADRVLESIRRALLERATITEEYPYVVGDWTYWFSSAFSPISDDQVVMVARDITERVAARRQLERDVQERTQELQTLLTVTRNVASTLELGPLLQLVLDQMKDIADYSRCSIFLLEGDSVVLRDSRSEESIGPAPFRIPLDLIQPLWLEIAAGKPVVVEDVRGPTEQAAAYRRGSGDLLETAFRDIHSWMGVPLISKDRLIGMLTLSHVQPAFYQEHHAGLVAGIATQIAVAIENARLYEQAQQLAAVEERQRLARELHDSVSQALYGIALGARTARTLIDRDPVKAAEPVEYVLSLAEAGLAEMRALIFELRPESLEIEGLVAALDKQIAATAARYGLQVSSELAEEPEMSLAQKEIFYRIGQEALHNVVKHARASHVSVRFARDNGSYVLEVADDGVGFNSGQSFPGHMGLVSMTERAVSIGAELQVDSKPGAGTSIKLSAPAG